MRVACVTVHDPADPEAFSGHVYHMTEAIKRQCELFEYLGPLSNFRYRPLLVAKRHVHSKLFGKKYYANRDAVLIKDYSRQIAKKLSRSSADIVFSPTSPGSQPIAYLECRQPIVIWADATFAGVLDFYPELSRSRLCRETIRDGLANERAALSRCSLMIYKSKWAAETAVKHHGVDPAKIRVVPGGPSFECNLTFDDAEAIVASRPSDRCKLLFLGMDWQRKGGDIALQVAERLNELGVRTELTVVGARPLVDGALPDLVRPLGPLRKSNPEEFMLLKRTLAESHFLILPTQAEAMGIVFCEASAFALPSLATDVGGVTSAVRDEINGKIFPLGADVEAYCAYIASMFGSYNLYKQLSLSSFNEYETRLNWNVASQTVTSFIAQLL